MKTLIRRISTKFVNRYNRYKNYFIAYGLMFRTLYYKECYFGPFVGEFGHLLSHVVPFLSYLHSKGVKIYYCGPEIHSTFFVDDLGKTIITRYYPLRDFYSEISPICNDQLYPDDVNEKINIFIEEAKNSKYPFWDIRTRDFYWVVFCNWEYSNNFVKVYDLSKVYKSNNENSVVIFPRKKGAVYSPYYGSPWDFKEVANSIKHLFDTVYIIGHPSFSADIKSFDNVKTHFTNNNKEIVQICSNSKLIINQFSGTHYLSIYTQTPVLFIYHGQIRLPKIVAKGNRIREKLGDKQGISFAHSTKEIIDFVNRNIIKK